MTPMRVIDISSGQMAEAMLNWLWGHANLMQGTILRHFHNIADF